MAAVDTDDADKLMSRDHVQTLRDKGTKIVDNLMMSDIMTSLLEVGILTPRHQHDILAHTSRFKQAEEFLDILVTKSDWAYNSFVDVLSNNGYKHIARELERPGLGTR